MGEETNEMNRYDDRIMQSVHYDFSLKGGDYNVEASAFWMEENDYCMLQFLDMKKGELTLKSAMQNALCMYNGI